MIDLEFHDAANIFPLDDEHLDELAADIKAHGQRVAIELFEGKILDGRRRWQACKIAGVEPITMQVSPEDPVAYVLSLNLHRRHLSTGQAASCSVRAEKLQEKLRAEATERQKAGRPDSLGVPDNCPEPPKGDTRDKIGEQFGISGKSHERAKKVHATGIPELVEALDKGKISVNKAEYIARHEKPIQRDLLEAELRQPQKPSRRAEPATPDARPAAKDRRRTEEYAMNMSRVAITQLEAIPAANPFRDVALGRVEKWIRSQRGTK